MRLFLASALLLAVLSTTRAFPATKNGPLVQIDEDNNDSQGPPIQVEEDNFDSHGPVPNGPHQNSDPPIQVEEDNFDSHGPVPNGPHQNSVMDEKSAGHENDHMVMMKRRPYEDSAWEKSGSTVEIPYTTSGVDSEVLTRAIEVFNAKTCVRFIPRSSQNNYVRFQSGRSCVAEVGSRESGMQTCTLTSGCASNKGKVLHEMMHVLGFLHEQCRPDRDSYVTIHTDRIKSTAVSNFDLISESINQNIPYDCDSILHYRSTAFAATSGQETITSTHCSHLGNGDTRLSLLDYKRVNTLYSCGMPQYKYYTVRVVTDSSWLSGTDCFIYLTLHGSSQTSSEFELDLSTDPNANLFESGSDDTFNYMAYRNDLGSITGMSLRMVSSGSGPAWWPTKFIITDPATSTSVTFTSNQWLSPSSTYGTNNFSTQ